MLTKNFLNTLTEPSLKFGRLGTLFLKVERQRKAQVVSIAYDDPQCGWRVRFRVPGAGRNDEWSTVRTEPPLDVRCTRFAGKFLELIFFDEPGWTQGEEVTLTLEPYEQEKGSPIRV